MTLPGQWLARWRALKRPLRLLPRAGAIALLALCAAFMAWTSDAAPRLERADEAEQSAKTLSHETPAIGDFVLYARIHARVSEGESYYAAAVAEQRAHTYPTRPFLTVRLPTLAWSHALFGAQMIGYGAVLLLVTVIAVFLPTLQPRTLLYERVAGALLLLFGGAGVFAAQAPLVHELIAGLFLSLALLVYRPNRWWPSLVCVALALAVRELALPFALLWLGFALVQQRWREALALVALVALFVAALYLHARGVDAQVLPGDRGSPGWGALAGPALPLLSLARLSLLLVLPLAIAAPLAVLPLLGWIGLGGRLGLFASLWFLGFFVAIALFARAENFYWVMMVLPAYLAGFAFVPRALADLLAAATNSRARLS